MKKTVALRIFAMLISICFSACTKRTEPSQSDDSEPPAATVNPLTGLERGEDYKYGARPVAVIVNNIMSRDEYQSAWPQSGLSEADIIYEMETEGGITRYMAIFRDYGRMPVTGPVRSARDQFVQMMIPFGSLFVHDGCSTYAQALLDRFAYADKDLTPDKGVTFRDLTLYNRGLKAYEHTEYTSGKLISDAIADESNGLSGYYTEPSNAFKWAENGTRALKGKEISEIYFNFSKSYRARITYDEATGKYTKEHINIVSDFSKPLVDANLDNAPVEFDNAFVLWTQISRYPDGILSNVSLNFGGVGYYFNGGRMEKVRWIKGGANDPLKIVTLDGTETEIEINPGKSYIAVVSLDYFGTFSLDGELVDAYGDYSTAEEIGTEQGVESDDN